MVVMDPPHPAKYWRPGKGGGNYVVSQLNHAVAKRPHRILMFQPFVPTPPP